MEGVNLEELPRAKQNATNSAIMPGPYKDRKSFIDSNKRYANEVIHIYFL